VSGGRPSIPDQVDDLVNDLLAMHDLAQAGSLLARGAALSTAHAALVLAVTLPPDQEDKEIRWHALQDAIPTFARFGLAHIGPLIQAALDIDSVAGNVSRGVEQLQ
jgi:hypothetical protein